MTETIHRAGVSWNGGSDQDVRAHEVLLGADQTHLAFRASVLVEPDLVVVSTVVELRNRRGHAYFALVRWLHPFVVRAMLACAARTSGDRGGA